MALTAKVTRIIPMFGSHRIVHALLTHDGAYPAAGEVLDAVTLGMAKIYSGQEIGDRASALIRQVFVPGVNFTTGKIKAYVDDATTGVPAEATADQLDSALTINFEFLCELV